MHIDPARLSLDDRYKLLIGAIVPRPIAWVSTIDPHGRTNLAPFSFFAGVSANPMALLFCPANTPAGHEKDTLRNCKPAAEGGTGELVVNVVPHRLARQMAACAEPLPWGESEFALAGLAPEPSTVVRPPRVRGCPFAFECRTLTVTRLAPGQPSGGNIVLAQVLAIHADDAAVNDRFHLDPAALDALGRMGGRAYCTTRDRLEMPMGRAALGGE